MLWRLDARSQASDGLKLGWCVTERRGRTIVTCTCASGIVHNVVGCADVVSCVVSSEATTETSRAARAQLAQRCVVTRYAPERAKAFGFPRWQRETRDRYETVQHTFRNGSIADDKRERNASVRRDELKHAAGMPTMPASTMRTS